MQPRLATHVHSNQRDVKLNRFGQFHSARIEREFRRDEFVAHFKQNIGLAVVAVIAGALCVANGLALQHAGVLALYDFVILFTGLALLTYLLWRRHRCAQQRVALNTAGSGAAAVFSPFGKRETLALWSFDVAAAVVVCMLALRPGVFFLRACATLWSPTPPAPDSLCATYLRSGSTSFVVALPVPLAIFFAAVVTVSQVLAWCAIATIFGFAIGTYTALLLALKVYTSLEVAGVVSMASALLLGIVVALMAARRRTLGLRGYFAATLVMEEQHVDEAKLQARLANEAGQRARLEAVQRAHIVVGHFIAHQLRNPLHQLRLLLDSHPASPRVIDVGAQQAMQDAVQRMQRVVEDMELHQAVEEGTLSVQPVDRVDVRKLIADAVQSTVEEMPTVLLFDQSVPALVHSDSKRLRQLVSALLAATVQLHKRAGTASRFSVDTPATKIVRFTVEFAHDNNLETPLSPRAQLGDTSLVNPSLMHSWQRQQAAIGLSLDIAKALARAFGGDCGVVDAFSGNHVTRIAAWVPVLIADTAPIDQQQAAPVRQALSKAAAANQLVLLAPHAGLSAARTTVNVSATSPRHARRVLVVDDDVLNQQLHARLLRRLGYATDVCGDGDEVLPFLQRAARDGVRVDAIMLDIVMPRLDGISCCKLLRANSVHIPILAVTANASHEELDKFLACGFTALLPKPFTSASLRDLLLQVLPGNDTLADDLQPRRLLETRAS